MGTKLLSRQLRFEDDTEETLMFYAAASSPEMFAVVKGLVQDTIGVAGLAEQLRHNCARGTNVLMKASNDEEVHRARAKRTSRVFSLPCWFRAL